MRYSIKSRLVKNFMLIIIITVLILDFFLISGIRHYYYRNIEELLDNQLKFSIDYLEKYLEVSNLSDIIIDDIDLFWNQTTAQIQVFNLNGDKLLDSVGENSENTQLTSDLKKAQSGEKGVWIGHTDYYNGEVMRISRPIISKGKIVGILRFTSSMQATKNLINNLALILISLGGIVILISGIVAYFLANSIVRPLERVTEAAEKMADGQLDIRSDVSLDDEIGKLSDTINYMAEEILKKEALKTEFISSISHELKTPLTSIKGWAITLQDDSMDKDIILEGLGIIEEESDRLSDMLEELLDFSRFVSGDISLRKNKFNVDEVLKNIYRQLSPIAKLQGINLILEKKMDLGYLIGDKDRLKQVLLNLLDNAFKFSSDGSDVTLQSYLKDENLIIKVIDNGSGIADDELPNVKEKFYKGTSSKSHTGIGLSICDEIVSLHRGKLYIKSELGKGTIVTVILPRGDCE